MGIYMAVYMGYLMGVLIRLVVWHIAVNTKGTGSYFAFAFVSSTLFLSIIIGDWRLVLIDVGLISVVTWLGTRIASKEDEVTKV